MDRRFQFEVRVRRCLDGHVWLDDVDADCSELPAAVLATRTAAELRFWEKKEKVEEYEPLKRESGLFRIFAGLPIERDAIRDFADTYGLICDGAHQFQFRDKGRDVPRPCTPLSVWRQNILSVRYWLKVWDLICANDQRGLLKHVTDLQKRLDDSALEDPEEATFLVDAYPILESAPKHRLRVAKKCLEDAVLRTRLYGYFAVHLKYDEHRDTFGFRLLADDLAAAIWAQFAMAIVDSKEYVCCKTCGKPFEVSPEVARTNREYCRTACRLKAFRARKRAAARLKKRGKSLKDIANQLGSDVATVRGWIKQAEEK